jgi:acylphosphatase
MILAKKVRYRGRVQGVGFRWTARNVAENYPVAGYVRNLPGGDVELVAEGEPDAVAGFLAALARRMEDYIEGSAVEDEAPAALRGFRIRY